MYKYDKDKYNRYTKTSRLMMQHVNALLWWKKLIKIEDVTNKCTSMVIKTYWLHVNGWSLLLLITKLHKIVILSISNNESSYHYKWFGFEIKLKLKCEFV